MSSEDAQIGAQGFRSLARKCEPPGGRVYPSGPVRYVPDSYFRRTLDFGSSVSGVRPIGSRSACRLRAGF
jgi:hypothetical protein